VIKITCECKHGNRYAKSGKYQNGTHEYINFRLGDQGLAVQGLKNMLERKMELMLLTLRLYGIALHSLSSIMMTR